MFTRTTPLFKVDCCTSLLVVRMWLDLWVCAQVRPARSHKIRFRLIPGTGFTLTPLFVGNLARDLEIVHFEEHDDRSIEARFLILLLLRLNSCVFHPSPSRWGIRYQNRMVSQSTQACKLVEAVAGILLDLAVLVLLKIKHFEMRIREPFKKKER